MKPKVGDYAVVIGTVQEMMDEYSTNGYEQGEVFVIKNVDGGNGVTKGAGGNWIYEKHFQIITEDNCSDEKLKEILRKRKEEEKRKEELALMEASKREEKIAKALEGNPLRTQLKNYIKGDPGLCAFAIRFYGEEHNLVVAGPCHAQLGGSGRKIVECILHVKGHIPQVVGRLKGYSSPEVAESNYKKWLDYIINRSPWSIAYITKDVDEAVEDGIVMNVNVPHDIFISAAIAVRTGNEFPQTSFNFNKALEAGATEPQAAFLSCFLTLKQAYWQNQGGHHCMSSTLNFKEVVAFYEKGFSFDKLLYKELASEQRNRTGYGVTASVASDGGPTCNHVLKEFSKGSAGPSDFMAVSAFPKLPDLVIALQKEWK